MVALLEKHIPISHLLQYPVTIGTMLLHLFEFEHHSGKFSSGEIKLLLEFGYSLGFGHYVSSFEICLYLLLVAQHHLVGFDEVEPGDFRLLLVPLHFVNFVGEEYHQLGGNQLQIILIVRILAYSPLGIQKV